MTVISPLFGSVVDDDAAPMDIKMRRGDDLEVPFTFMVNRKVALDATITYGSSDILSPSSPFVSGDVGKSIIGDGVAFGATVATFVNAGHITISDPLLKTATLATVMWGDALDVSGWTIAAQVRRHRDSSVVRAEFDVDASGAADGLIVISLPSGTTRTLADARLVWDLQRTESGKIRTLFAGAFVVSGDTTRP